MAKKREAFIQLVIEESYSQLLSEKNGYSLREIIETTAYREKQRAKRKPWKVDPKDDLSYWEGVQKQVAQFEGLEVKAKNDALKTLLKAIIRRYVYAIAGNFKPSRHKLAHTLITIGLGRLLNASRVKGPWSLFSSQLNLGDKVHVKGHVNQLRKLAQLGTVVMVPTHFSNLDSALFGWIIQYLGLPPFIYGAGLNLFNIKLFAYFMNSIGVYRVDRRKKNPIYLTCLNSYSTIALREGCHTLFFPGGTRSRSGKIEKNLKLGLLGTTIEAQRQIFQNEEDNKIFIVPVTLNYHFVLEAPSLIHDYLKAKGQERYYEENDELTTSFKISKFLVKFFTHGSDISLSIGSALDVVGNEVDEQGNSRDKQGNLIDLRDYFKSNGEVTEDLQREQEYNKILSKSIVQAYHKHHRVFSSHMAAFTAFHILSKAHKQLDLYGLLRISGDDLMIPYADFEKMMKKLLEALKSLQAAKQIDLADHLSQSIAHVIAHGVKNLGMYHPQPPLCWTKSGDIQVQSMNLLYYYRNRLSGYDLEKHI